MTDTSIRILLIEDSPFATRHVQEMLEHAQSTHFHTKLTCTDRLSTGIDLLKQDAFDIILLDLTLPDSFELETFTRVNALAAEIPIIVISGIEDEIIAMEAVHKGAQDYLVKGKLYSDLLKRTITYSLERKQTEQHIYELNQQLEQRLTELNDINQELKNFSHSVSHDLRAPLRAIDGFSRILFEEYNNTLDDEGKRLINIILDNTKKMGLLINDLLSYSRLAKQEIVKKDIDMEKLANKVWKELTRHVPEGKYRLKINKLPFAVGDPSVIRVVVLNLLSNAIKFTGTKKIGMIEISGKVEKGMTTYHVKDNGVGFDMQYSDKLFQIFQRLHHENEFEGTGVGLSIVQRVIKRHGGRVSAQGELNKGAVFSFSLPKENKQEVDLG